MIRNSIHNDTAFQDPPGLKGISHDAEYELSSMRNTGSEEENEKAGKDKFKRKIGAGRGETDPSIYTIPTANTVCLLVRHTSLRSETQEVFAVIVSIRAVCTRHSEFSPKIHSQITRSNAVCKQFL